VAVEGRLLAVASTSAVAQAVTVRPQRPAPVSPEAYTHTFSLPRATTGHQLHAGDHRTADCLAAFSGADCGVDEESGGPRSGGVRSHDARCLDQRQRQRFR
jgi:hypothetical protein